MGGAVSERSRGWRAPHLPGPSMPVIGRPTTRVIGAAFDRFLRGEDADLIVTVRAGRPDARDDRDTRSSPEHLADRRDVLAGHDHAVRTRRHRLERASDGSRREPFPARLDKDASPPGRSEPDDPASSAPSRRAADRRGHHGLAPSAWTVSIDIPSRAQLRAAPSTVVGMSCSFRSRNTRRERSHPRHGRRTVRREQLEPDLEIPASPSSRQAIASAASTSETIEARRSAGCPGAGSRATRCHASGTRTRPRSSPGSANSLLAQVR